MTHQPVTVVIPTRDRPDTLVHCLRTVLNQDYPALSVIVSDNDSGPETTAVIESFHDPRIRQVRTGKRISMSHNFEFGMSHVTSGWATLLGDDDGLLPDALGKAVAKVEASGLQAMSSFTCGYHWPSRLDGKVSVLSVPMGRSTWRVNARKAMARVIAWEMDRLVLPQTYTGGLIHHDLFQRIKAIKGSFYQSQIPDIYSGFAICSSVDEYLCTDEPFAIAGASGHSNGAALFNMEKTKFLDEGNIPWHAAMPMPEWGTLAFSMPAIVCESYLQSSYLHDDFLTFTPARMLELILTESHDGAEILAAWATDFAAMHSISAAIGQGNRPVGRRIASLRQRADGLLGRYRVRDGDGLTISDVHAASLIADTIRTTRPSRVRSVVSTVSSRKAA